MFLRTVLREAFIALSRHWIRSVLTILGIAVGVGAFICVVAIGNAGTGKLEDQLQSLGDNFIWVEAGSRTRGGMRMGAPPAGGVSTVRGMGCRMSHCSTLTITQTASRAPFGSASGGRSAIAE